MPLQTCPNEILLQVAEDLGLEDLLHLLQANRFFATLLTPLLHTFALKPKDGMPAIFWAAAKGHEPLVALLLGKGVDVNLADETCNGPCCDPTAEENILPKRITALYLAMGNAHPSITKLLLSNGADPHAMDHHGRGPLHYAVDWQNVEIVKLLLEVGADVNKRCKCDMTVLHIAVGQLRDAEMVKLLLEAGADINASGDNMPPPLHIAVGSCVDSHGILPPLPPSEEVVRLLLENGADANSYDYMNTTPLHRQIMAGVDFPGGPSLRIIQQLLESGADINARNGSNINDQTAIFLAIYHNVISIVDVVEFLVKMGADTTLLGWGQSLLHLAMHGGRGREYTDSERLVKILLQTPISINVRNIHGETPLHWAVRRGCRSARMVRLLLENGADSKIQDNDGATVRESAIERHSWSALHVIDSFNKLQIK